MLFLPESEGTELAASSSSSLMLNLKDSPNRYEDEAPVLAVFVPAPVSVPVVDDFSSLSVFDFPLNGRNMDKDLASFLEELPPKRPLEDCVDEPFSDESFSSPPPIPDSGLRVPSESRLLLLRDLGLDIDKDLVSFLLEVEENGEVADDELTSVFLAPLPGDPEAGEVAGGPGGSSSSILQLAPSAR